MPDTHADSLASPEVPARLPLFFALGVVLLIAAAMAGLWFLFTAEEPGRRPPTPATFPAPRLESDPAVDLKRALSEQEKRLAGYRWVDRDRQIIAIPIERAMAIEAARGDDAFAPIDAAEKGGTAEEGAQ